MTTLITDDQFIDELRKTGIAAKRWRNTGEFTPPADVNYKGELRVHTGGQPELIATDEKFRQAIIRPTRGRYDGESFLVGMDETSNFVCRLPEAVDTVEKAHEVLRPTGLLPHTVRQGEWFFVPVENEVVSIGDMNYMPNRTLQGTTHSAEHTVEGYLRDKDGKITRHVLLAKGLISDSRKGRHAPVDLGDKWHEVIRNTERPIAVEPARPRRTFD